MEEVRERISLIFSNFATNINKFSDGDKALRNRLTRQINNDAAITIDTINIILETYPEVSAEWLLRGEGEMILSDNLPPIIGDESDNDLSVQARLTQSLGKIDTLTQTIESLKNEIAKLNKELLKKDGCIEWQKDFISEIMAEKLELEKKVPQEPKKEDIV